MMAKRRKKTQHEFTAALRMEGAKLDVDALVKALGRKPDNSHRIGDPKRAQEKWADSMCSFDSKLPRKATLEDQLKSLLDEFEPRKKTIAKFKRRGTTGYFWCGHFTDAYLGFCGVVGLSAPLLKRLGAFGFEVLIDTYADTNFNS